MATRILPMRKIFIQPCWPHSGKKYEVWENDRVILNTNSLKEAEAKASEV